MFSWITAGKLSIYIPICIAKSALPVYKLNLRILQNFSKLSRTKKLPIDCKCSYSFNIYIFSLIKNPRMLRVFLLKPHRAAVYIFQIVWNFISSVTFASNLLFYFYITRKEKCFRIYRRLFEFNKHIASGIYYSEFQFRRYIMLFPRNCSLKKIDYFWTSSSALNYNYSAFL